VKAPGTAGSGAEYKRRRPKEELELQNRCSKRERNLVKSAKTSTLRLEKLQGKIF
jgi:hypothetical protein